ncbi:kinase-like domain-containing protein [Rhodocollybia butyracea]|uniref:non-specific serine/threonine protein kinase n=1 Tax=Rhodocollybia butyracea TaxID=206335 RepID=A0A9P5PXI3_9AGAR|nr:kinase-like domain-containing protein [Rhodocollybia butyracea]
MHTASYSSSAAGPSRSSKAVSPGFSRPSVVTTSLAKTTLLADGKKMINRYVMDAKVGSGQHGNVWRCYDYNYSDGQSPVLAMKIVKRDNPKAKRDRQYKMLRAGNSNNSANSVSSAKRTTPTVVDGIRTAEQEIRKEIAIMKKCRHPHVVKLFEVIDDRKNNKVFMIMEYLGGGEIQYTTNAGGGPRPVLTVEQTRRIIRDAILGLEYLHHQGIIHRDIKPANLLWSTGHETVKIADFGTAHFSYAQRLAAAKADPEALISPWQEEDPLLLNDADLAKRAGSPAFLAPEIVWEFTAWPKAAKWYPSVDIDTSSGDGERPPRPPRPPVTKSIDIWALGVTLYCLLFGKVPFRLPDEGEDKRVFTEWVGYGYICNKDWRKEQRMGREGVPTGYIKRKRISAVNRGDDARREEEGRLVMHLLDHLLTKDLQARITLQEVKVR